MNVGDECPGCGSIMGVEEADWGCYCCGYPDNDPDEDDDCDMDDGTDDYLTEDDL